MENKKTRAVRVCSTAWRRIELTAISNYDDDIKILKRKWNAKKSCWVKTLEFKATLASVEKMRKILNHIDSNCGLDCKYYKKMNAE